MCTIVVNCKIVAVNARFGCFASGYKESAAFHLVVAFAHIYLCTIAIYGKIIAVDAILCCFTSSNKETAAFHLAGISIRININMNAIGINGKHYVAIFVLNFEQGVVVCGCTFHIEFLERYFVSCNPCCAIVDKRLSALSGNLHAVAAGITLVAFGSLEFNPV